MSHLGLHSLLNIIYERVIGKIKIKPSAITNRLSINHNGRTDNRLSFQLRLASPSMYVC